MMSFAIQRFSFTSMETKYLESNPLVPNVATLESLAEDRPEKTNELFTPNDFYGHAEVLKQYCGLPADFQIPGILPHGPYFSEVVWKPEIQHPLQNLFLISRSQIKRYGAYSSKNPIVIGSPVYYASKMISDQIEEARQSAEGTVVFPAHSTHHVTTHFEEDRLMEYLNGLPDEWKPIRICLYWKDILLGRHHLYSKAGFPCVTAGHMFDKEFIFRMLPIICSHRRAVTNRIGSCSIYAAAFGVPSHLFEQETNSVSDEEQFNEMPNTRNLPFAREFLKTMRRDIDEAAPTQKRIAEDAMGLKDLKSPEELRSLFEKHAGIAPANKVSIPSASGIEEHYVAEGTMEEVLEKLRSSLSKYPRNVPGKICLDGNVFKYQDLHKFYSEAVRLFQQGCYNFTGTSDAPVIVDCGAYVGLTTLYYAQKFPEASIHSFEGDPIRARMAQDNLNSSGAFNARVYGNAVWIEEGHVPFEASGAGSGAGPIEVAAIRLKTFIGTNSIDLLRLNIKGAEIPVLKDCAPLLPQMGMVIIELQSPSEGDTSFDELSSLFREHDFEVSFKEHEESNETVSEDPSSRANRKLMCKSTLYAWRRKRDG
jgi:FkbM family methyltransferase